MTIALSIPLLGKMPSKFEWIGVVGGLIFALGMLWDGKSRNISLIDLTVWLSIPFSYSLANIYVKKRFQNISPLLTITIPMTLSTFLLFPFALATLPEVPPIDLQISLVALLVLGTIGTGLAGYLFYILIYRAGPVFAGMVGYIIPLVALFWGFILGEAITTLQVVSLGGMLSMVAIAGKEPENKF